MAFEVGDTVLLKSGGPLMTVGEVYSGGECLCIWFVNHESGKSNNEVFLPEVLRLAS